MISQRKLRWTIGALLFFASVINYIDRQTLSVLAPVLTKELHIGPVQYAAILQAFLIAYTLMYVGSGLICDRLGTRWSLALFMAWWSAAGMLHAVATNVWQLGLFRLLLGAGESGNFMASIKAVSETFPKTERGFANGLINAGAAVGAVTAVPLVVWLNARQGWRAAFAATGAIGFLWLAIWLRFYKSPPPEPITEPARPSLLATWTGLLRHRQTWGLMLARLISDPVWWFYLFWLPKYLADQRGFTMREIGMLSWLPYLAADCGSIGGGAVSGWLLTRFHWAPLRSRLAVMAGSAAVMPVSVAVALTPSNRWALGLICLIACAHMAWKTNLMTVTNDIYPQPVVGSVAGIVAFGSGAGAFLFTALTGLVAQNFGYTAIFALMGLLHPISWFVVRALVRCPLDGRLDETEPA